METEVGTLQKSFMNVKLHSIKRGLSMNRAKIVIVEEDTITAEDLKLILLHFNYEVCGILSTPSDVVRQVRNLEPHLVIMDINFEGSDKGLEAADYIINKLKIPVIVLTAVNDPKVFQKAVNVNPSGYISKPFLENNLHFAIQIALNNYERHHCSEENRTDENGIVPRLYKNIYESAAAMIFIANHEKKFISVNSRATELLGYTKEEFMNMGLSDITHPDDLEKSREIYLNIVNGIIDHQDMIKRYICKDGSILHGYFSPRPLKNKNGKIEAIVCTIIDITGQARSEKELEQSREELKKSLNTLSAIIENTDQLILICDRQGIPVTYNTAYANFIKQAIGSEMKPGLMLHIQSPNPEYREWRENIHKRVLSGEKFREEFTYLFTDGSLRHFEIFCHPIIEKGEVNGFTEFSRDITDRKYSEERIKSALKEKEVLLKELHHRVKNNFQVVISLMSLHRSKIGNCDGGDFLMDCQQRIKTIAMVHEKMFQSDDFSKINISDYAKKLLHELLKTFGANIKNLKTKVTAGDIFFTLEKAIPTGLILNEIITNSLKHAFNVPSANQPEIKISIEELQEGKVLISAEDNGTGIGDDIDFERTESLGMNLIKLISEIQLKGTLEISRNKGTYYRLCFPI